MPEMRDHNCVGYRRYVMRSVRATPLIRDRARDQISAQRYALVGSQLLRRIEAMAMAGSLNGMSHAAGRALNAMALNALDTEHDGTPPDIYFRGWDHLAACLGYGGIEHTPAARSAVQRAMRELTDRGLIKAEGHLSGRASPMVYRLTL